MGELLSWVAAVDSDRIIANPLMTFGAGFQMAGGPMAYYGFIRKAEAEERRQKQLQMIVDAAPVLEQPYAGMRNLSRLPHSKNDLIQAFLNQIANMPDRRTVSGLCEAIIRLAFFQPRAESHPFCAPGFDTEAAVKMPNADFAKLAGSYQKLVEAQSADFREIRTWIETALEANPHLLPWYVKLWHRFRRQGAYSGWDDDFIEVPYVPSNPAGKTRHAKRPRLSAAAQHLELEELPLTGATPDIAEAKPFDERPIGDYLALAFRDISPLGKSVNGRAAVEYPFVLALVRSSDRAPVFFVTVEAGMLFDTYMLCSFDTNGRHSNYGSWSEDAGDDAFVARGLEIAESRIARASKSKG